VSLPQNISTAMDISLVDILGVDLVSALNAGDEIKVVLQGKTLQLQYGDRVYGPKTYKDVVSNVVINGGDPITDPAEWGEYIEISLTNGILSYRLLNEKVAVKFTIRRSYVTAEDVNVEQIVDGWHEYVFSVNDTSVNYSVRFIEDTVGTTSRPDADGNQTYVKHLKNGDAEEGLTTVYDAQDPAIVIGYAYNMQIKLVANATAGDVNSGTVFYNELDVQLSEMQGDTSKFGSIETIGEYDTTNGNFTLNLPQYIAEDTTLTFTVFTSQGYLATIEFVIEANATVEFKDFGSKTLSLEYAPIKVIKGE
jgi:hypothetical protein